jgi:hypothetical protein
VANQHPQWEEKLANLPHVVRTLAEAIRGCLPIQAERGGSEWQGKAAFRANPRRAFRPVRTAYEQLIHELNKLPDLPGKLTASECAALPANHPNVVLVVEAECQVGYKLQTPAHAVFELRSCIQRIASHYGWQDHATLPSDPAILPLSCLTVLLHTALNYLPESIAACRPNPLLDRWLELGLKERIAGETDERKPEWDNQRRELKFDGKLVKRLRQRAENQQRILDEFEEQGWPSRIDDPLPGTSTISRSQRLADTLKRLNKNNQFLIFRRDGTTEGVIWEPKRP